MRTSFLLPLLLTAGASTSAQNWNQPTTVVSGVDCALGTVQPRAFAERLRGRKAQIALDGWSKAAADYGKRAPANRRLAR